MSFFKKIASALSGGLVKQAAGLIDNLVTSDEERELLKIKFKQLVQDHEAELQRLAHENTASARDMQKIALTQDDRFSKRFVYYLALLWSAAGIVYVFLATFTEVVNDRIADTVLGFLMGTIVSTIINYFFGSALPSTTQNIFKDEENKDNKNLL